MFWYVKEETWGHSNLYGPFDSEVQATEYKKHLPAIRCIYTIFSCKELLQLS